MWRSRCRTSLGQPGHHRVAWNDLPGSFRLRRPCLRTKLMKHIRHGTRIALLPLLLAVLTLGALGQPAKDKQPPGAASKGSITVKLVTDFDSRKPISDLESLQPV